MFTLSRLFRKASRPGRSVERRFPTPVADAQLGMGAALLYGLERKNHRLNFIEHCARVSELVDALAEKLGLAEDERADLRAAAQLHEIGMIAIPSALLEEPARLDDLSIARIRQQAHIGAEIVGITRPGRVPLLIDNQYADFVSIRGRFGEGSRESLLAGVLRAADVVDTMLHPRPYQASLDPAHTAEVLREGAGTKFHPLAVESMFRLRIGSGRAFIPWQSPAS